jgi:DNA-binding HxlR family transcriptional regulator
MAVSEQVNARVKAVPGDVFATDCPGREILDHVTTRWATLILGALAERSMRFYELRSKIGGISEKMLSQNLKTLVRDGLVTRTVEPSVPPKVSYCLTGTGSELTGVLWSLVTWIGAHTAEIKAAQDRHDLAAEGSVKRLA